MKLKKWIRAFVDRWIDVVERWHWFIALFMILVTAASLYVARNLTLETDLAALLPNDAPSVLALEEVKKKVGGLGNIIILIESPDSTANDQFARALIPALLESDYFGSVEYKRNMAYFEDRQLLYLTVDELKDVRDRVRKKIRYEINKRDPLFFLDEEDPGFDVSDIRDELSRRFAQSDLEASDRTRGGTSIVVRAYPVGTQEQVGFSRRMVAETERIIDNVNPNSFHPDMDAVVGGQYVNRIVEYEVILNDIKSTALIALIGILLIISIYFRQAFASVFVGIPLIMGMSWTFGITAIVIGNLNLITGFLVAVLAGLGIDFGIHSFARYIENKNGGHSTSDALKHALEHTGAALMTTGLTTAAAFYSLMITDFKGFSEFGFIAATGIVFALVATFLAFPSFIYIGERFGAVRHTAIRHKRHDSERRRFPAARTALSVVTIVIVASVVLLPQIEFQYDFGQLRADIDSHRRLKDRIYKTTTDPSNPVAVVVEDPVERVAVADTLRKRADEESSLIRSVLTLDMLVPEAQAEKLRIINSIERLLRGRTDDLLTGTDISQVQLDRWLNPPDTVRASELPEFALRRFRGVDGSLGEFVAVVPDFGLTKGDLVMQFADEVRDISTEKQSYIASGSAIIFADMLRLMIHDSEIAVSVTLGVIFLIVFIHFRRLKSTLIVLMPVVAGVLFMMGIMAVFGIKLNLYNMVVLPAILGIGVDNGVHLYHRYKEEGRGSLLLVLRNTGGPVLMTTLTTMVGFGGMVFADHQGLNSIGELALIGLGTCLVMSLVGLPSLLQVLEDRKKDPSQQSKSATTPVRSEGTI